MKREILCEACEKKAHPMHPEDVTMGFKRRRVKIAAKKPEIHGVEITEKGVTTFYPSSLTCDHCDRYIADGRPAFAVTWWNTNREEEPGAWEKDYSQ